MADVAVRYAAQPALDGVSLEVAPGRVVGLLGRNGAGKTTLIRAITGLLRPERGSIRVGGIDVAADPRATRRMLGAALQDLAVFPPLTVTENLWGWAELAGIGRSGRRRAVREVQDALGLAPLGDRPAHLLSGGEQRACLHDRRLLSAARGQGPLWGIDFAAAHVTVGGLSPVRVRASAPGPLDSPSRRSAAAPWR